MLMRTLSRDALRDLLRYGGVDLAQRRQSLAIFQRLQQVVGKVTVMELVALERLLVVLAGRDHNPSRSQRHVREHRLGGCGVGEFFRWCGRARARRGATVTGVEEDDRAQ